MKKHTLFAGCGLAISALSTLAFAHGGAEGIVKERMDAMMAMSKAVKALSAMMSGEAEYDADAVKKGAATIRTHAGEALTKLFPEHSGGKHSEAKPEVWSDWETFSAYAKQLAVFADGLEAAADNGLMHGDGGSMMGGQSGMMGGENGMMGGIAGMMHGGGMMGSAEGMMDADQLAQMPADGVFNMVAQTCTACHTKFRAEKH